MKEPKITTGDLTDMWFGKLHVIEKVKKNNGDKHSYWKCKCACGNTCIRRGYDLKLGRHFSCGCGFDEKDFSETWEDLYDKAIHDAKKFYEQERT